MKQKRHLTHAQEFEILKVVLDKFLLLGVFIMALGIYLIVATASDLGLGFAVLGTGMLVMMIFATLLVREYHFLKN